MSDDDYSSNEDSILRLRRFALGTSLALFVYVVGGGELREQLSVPFATVVHFQNPGVLLGLLASATFYAVIHYWYQAIFLSLTRSKIRKYLESPESILVFPKSEDDFSNVTNPALSKGGTWWTARNVLLTKLPDGMPRDHCIVIGHIGAAREHLSRTVATKLERYFPNLQPENVSLVSPGEGVYWAHISSKSTKTLLTCLYEDFDLWLPVTAGGLSLLLFLAYQLWPYLSMFISKL